MKRYALVAVACVATTAAAQDTSFAHLRVRGGALRLPSIGHIADDWRAGTGIQLDVASNVGPGELAIGVSRVAFTPTTGRPPFTETAFSLAWTRPIARGVRGGFDGGARLSDVRMDFDDPSLVGGLRTEEEVMLAVVGRADGSVGRGFSVFVEGAYGAFMLSTRTPTVAVAAGVQHGAPMPGWLRRILR